MKHASYEYDRTVAAITEYKSHLSFTTNKNYVVNLINSLEEKLKHLEKLKTITENTTTQYVVVETLPYTSCCESGPFETECTYFSSKISAAEYKELRLKIDPSVDLRVTAITVHN